MKDLYRILEVDKSASKGVITAAYKVLAKKYHPDLCEESEKASNGEKMKELNIAKETLLNDKLRDEYDIKLKQEEDRILNEKIQNKINANRNKTYSSKNYKEKTDNYSQKSSELNMFDIFNSVRKYVFLALIFLIPIIIIITFLTKTPGTNKDIQNNENTTSSISSKIQRNLVDFKTGINQNEAMTLLGNPDEITSAYLKYGDAKVLLSNGNVIGWIDTYKELPINRHTGTVDQNDVQVGEDEKTLLETYGLPDTYSNKLIVYDNLFLYMSNKKISKIEYVKKR